MIVTNFSWKACSRSLTLFLLFIYFLKNFICRFYCYLPSTRLLRLSPAIPNKVSKFIIIIYGKNEICRSTSKALGVDNMRRNNSETFTNACPYEQAHHRCEVKECDECVVLTEFCRNPPKASIRHRRTHIEIMRAQLNMEEVQLLSSLEWLRIRQTPSLS